MCDEAHSKIACMRKCLVLCIVVITLHIHAAGVPEDVIKKF